METRALGTSGLRVSVVGLGCNNFGARVDAAAAETVVHAALDAGVTLFDTAASYGDSEVILGKAIGGRRDEVVVATKFPSPRITSPHGTGSRRHVVAACDDSLRRLGTDWIDLYQMHRPDPETPIDETLEALDGLVRAGKVRYVGSSNFAGWQLADADWTSRDRRLARMVSAQNEYSLLAREAEREVLPACARFGIGLLPYFPLASGLLTGKYHRDQTPPAGSRLGADGAWPRLAARVLTARNFDAVDALTAVADESGVDLLHLVFGWLAAKPAVASVIAGATTPDQVRANVAAGSWSPPADVLGAVDTALAAVATSG